MVPCERFLGTFIEIEIDDVIVMINGFWIFRTNLWMVLLTIEKKKQPKQLSLQFFWRLKISLIIEGISLRAGYP